MTSTMDRYAGVRNKPATAVIVEDMLQVRLLYVWKDISKIYRCFCWIRFSCARNVYKLEPETIHGCDLRVREYEEWQNGMYFLHFIWKLLLFYGISSAELSMCRTFVEGTYQWPARHHVVTWARYAVESAAKKRFAKKIMPLMRYEK